jgi:hypothetical protein
LSFGFSLIFLTTKFSFGDPLGVGVPLFHLSNPIIAEEWNNDAQFLVFPRMSDGRRRWVP